MQDQKKHTQVLLIFFNFPNAPIWIKVLSNDCITFQLNKPYAHQKKLAEKQEFK